MERLGTFVALVLPLANRLVRYSTAACDLLHGQTAVDEFHHTISKCTRPNTPTTLASFGRPLLANLVDLGNEDLGFFHGLESGREIRTRLGASYAAVTTTVVPGRS